MGNKENPVSTFWVCSVSLLNYKYWQSSLYTPPSWNYRPQSSSGQTSWWATVGSKICQRAGPGIQCLCELILKTRENHYMKGFGLNRWQSINVQAHCKKVANITERTPPFCLTRWLFLGQSGPHGKSQSCLINWFFFFFFKLDTGMNSCMKN